MKYLKKFESYNIFEKEDIQSHLDEIKSVFQEYIDDFDIEELPADLEEDDDSVTGLFYHLYWYATDKRREKIVFKFDFYIYDNEDGDFSNKFIQFLKFKDEIKNSLTSRGYDVFCHPASFAGTTFRLECTDPSAVTYLASNDDMEAGF